jgi:hypothetical protein
MSLVLARLNLRYSLLPMNLGGECKILLDTSLRFHPFNLFMIKGALLL